MRIFALLLITCPWVSAEVHRLTLKEAVDLASRQNPDVLMARIEEQRAAQNITIQRDPFFPKLFAGSGAAWSSGYPQNIDGNAPSIVQARVIMSLYNRPQTLRVAQARESKRGAALESASTAD